MATGGDPREMSSARETAKTMTATAPGATDGRSAALCGAERSAPAFGAGRTLALWSCAQ